MPQGERSLDEITDMEEELGVIYAEAFSVIQAARTISEDEQNGQSHMEARGDIQQ